MFQIIVIIYSLEDHLRVRMCINSNKCTPLLRDAIPDRKNIAVRSRVDTKIFIPFHQCFYEPIATARNKLHPMFSFAV